MRFSSTAAAAVFAALVGPFAFPGGATALADVPEPLQACATCHRIGTEPSPPGVPYLDGQVQSYLVESIELLRDRKRVTQVPDHVPVSWTVAQVSAAAALYSTARGRQPTDPIDPALVAQGRDIFRDRCETCHAADGRETDPRGAGSPLLAGQQLSYLRSQILAYLKGERPYLVDMKKRSFRGLPVVLRGTAVSEPGATMTDADAEAISHFLASVPRTLATGRRARLR
jgi:cytochrome c553